MFLMLAPLYLRTLWRYTNALLLLLLLLLLNVHMVNDPLTERGTADEAWTDGSPATRVKVEEMNWEKRTFILSRDHSARSDSTQLNSTQLAVELS